MAKSRREDRVIQVTVSMRGQRIICTALESDATVSLKFGQRNLLERAPIAFLPMVEGLSELTVHMSKIDDVTIVDDVQRDRARRQRAKAGQQIKRRR